MRKAILSLILIWLSGLHAVRPAVAAENVALQLRWDNQFQFAGYFAAKWRGYYADAGLEVEIRPAVQPNGKILSAVTEVAEGRADFGVGAADILIAVDSGADLSVLATVFQQSAARFYYKKTTTIHALTDLTRLRVARKVNDLIDVEFQAMLLAEGIDPGDVPAVPHMPGMDHLLDGRADVIPGYSITMPYIAASRGCTCREIRPATYGVDFYGDSIFTTRKLTEEKPETVQRFVRASLKGWAYALEHPDDVAEKIARDLPRSAPVDDALAFNRFQIDGVRELTLHPIVELGHINPNRWRRMHKFLATAGVIQNSLDLERLIFNPEKERHEREVRLLKTLAFSLAAIIIVAVCFFTWILMLRKSVNRRTKDLFTANQALTASHERFLTVLDGIDATIYAADMETYEVLFMNKHMRESFGGDFTGEICWKVFRGEAGPCPHCSNDRLVDENGDATGLYVWQGENPITKKWYNNYDRAIEWVDGRLVRLQIATDISDLKCMENELLQARKMESVGILTGGIAHDFNNILYIITGNAELVLDDIPETHPAHDNIREIKSAALRAAGVVDQLLSFSRMADADVECVDPLAAVSEALTALRASIPETIAIRTQFPDTDVWISADRFQFKQVIMNICTNAAQAMADAGGIMDVSVQKITLDDASAEDRPGLNKGDYVQIAVGDTGPGIAPDIIDNIFDPYFTTKEVGKGSGMGLAVAHGVVKNHGGAIFANSPPGRGAVITVLLPVKVSL